MLLLNQDAYVEKETIAELSSFMDQQADIGVVSPLHCSPDLTSVDAKTLQYYLHPFARDYLSDAMLGRVRPYYRIRGINAAAWFIRTSVFGIVGGFDPIFFMYGEDDDLLERMGMHDIPFALLPATRLVHLRQSPASGARPSYWTITRRNAAKERIRLISTLKKTDCRFLTVLRKLVTASWRVVFSDAFAHGTPSVAIAYGVALFSVVRDMAKIRDHARVCARPGQHFLPK